MQDNQPELLKMTIQWQRHTLEQYPGSLWDDWDKLNAEYNQGHPMLCSTFVTALIKYFPPSNGLEILVGKSGGSVVAMIIIETPRLGISCAYRPSQAQVGLLLIPPKQSISFTDLVASLPLSTARLDLFFIDSKFHGQLIDTADPNLQLSANNIVLDIEGDFSTYWESRPKNLRKNISRYINKINREQQGYLFKVSSCEEDMRLAVARYGFMESRGWKGHIGTALHPGNAQGNFYRDVMQAYASKQQAKVLELYLGSTLIASRLCIHNEYQFIILKTTFDEQYRTYSAGKVLLYEAIGYVFEQGLSSTIDFYTNASKEQLDWSTGNRSMYNLSIYHSLPGYVLGAGISIRNALLKKPEPEEAGLS